MKMIFWWVYFLTYCKRDLVEPRKQHGGSRPGRATNLSTDRAQWHDRIWKDYFSATPVYDEKMFWHRHRMRKSLFLSIMDRVVAHDAYFVQRKGAAGVFSLSSIQKCTAALRMLAYGIAADAIDEYCRLGENTAMETMKQFVVTIRAYFQSLHTWDNLLVMILNSKWGST